MKKCTKCNQELELKMFSKMSSSKDGLKYVCKICSNLNNKEWRENNPHRILEKRKEWHSCNPTYQKEHNKKFRKNNPDKIKQNNVNYHQNNKSKIAKHFMIKYNNEALFKLKVVCRALIGQSFKRALKGMYKKGKKTEDVLGCTLEEFINHLESQFVEGMTLKNHGEWEIDHIIPLASAKNEEDIYKLNYYTNFQPLWKEDNRRKGAKLI